MGVAVGEPAVHPPGCCCTNFHKLPTHRPMETSHASSSAKIQQDLMQLLDKVQCVEIFIQHVLPRLKIICYAYLEVPNNVCIYTYILELYSISMSKEHITRSVPDSLVEN